MRYHQRKTHTCTPLTMYVLSYVSGIDDANHVCVHIIYKREMPYVKVCHVLKISHAFAMINPILKPY